MISNEKVVTVKLQNFQDLQKIIKFYYAATFVEAAQNL